MGRREKEIGLVNQPVDAHMLAGNQDKAWSC